MIPYIFPKHTSSLQAGYSFDNVPTCFATVTLEGFYLSVTPAGDKFIHSITVKIKTDYGSSTVLGLDAPPSGREFIRL